MKLKVCILIVFIFASGCRSITSNYTQQSAIDPRKQVIYSSSGNRRGYLQQSRIDPRRTVSYDKHGNQKGYWRQSPVDPRKTVFIEK